MYKKSLIRHQLFHDKLFRLRLTVIQVCNNPETTTESLNYAVYKYAFLVIIDFVFKYGVISL